MSSKIIIEAGKEDAHYWKDLWKFKGLFYFLAWRDILVRYKQTTIGILWAILRPLFSILALTFVRWIFGGKTDIGGIPAPLLIAVGTLPWHFFSSAFSDISNSLLGNANLISKVYFPRIIVPASTVIVCFIDFLISFVIVLCFMLYYHRFPGIEILFLPGFLLLALVTAMGTGLYVASLNVKFRDFKYIIPFVIQFGMYVSPVMYSSQEIYNRASIPQWLKIAYSLNPMVGVIDGFRWSVLGDQVPIHWMEFSISLAISLLFLVIGVRTFRR
ncbi:MAG: ABC transporter permease, partial [Bacteroidia bacterium]